MKLYLMLFGCLAIVSCQHQEHNHHQHGQFKTTQPLVADTFIYKEYVAQIHSIQHIELRALEKGYIQQIYFDEGQKVTKGQLLVQIMPLVYKAETKRAKAEVSFAEIEYQNTKALADSQIVSSRELALSKSKLDKAEAELALAEAHLGFTEIRAPFDGIMGRFNDVRVGSLVDEGELLTTISDNSKVWVYFNMPETEYLEFMMKEGPSKDAEVLLQLANNALYPEKGIIEAIEADFNNETGNIAFRATFNNPNRLLRNGETGNVLLPIALKNAILVPQKATFEVLDKKYVYVVDEQGVLQATEIKVGAEMAHLYAVTQGLSPNQKVLVEGLRKVKNGQTVAVANVEMRALLSELSQLKAE